MSSLTNMDFLAGDMITILNMATQCEPDFSNTPEVTRAKLDLQIVMRGIDVFLTHLRRPISTTPETLIRAIDMHREQNIQAHPVVLARLTAPAAVDRLNELDALTRQSNAVSTEMSALDFTISWYIEQQFKEVNGTTNTKPSRMRKRQSKRGSR